MVTRRAACSGPARSFQEADVCRGRGCWRTEGWAPELKQKRGRPASAVADGHELAVQSFISLILQIEGQRYKEQRYKGQSSLCSCASADRQPPIS